jgi:hypothetical protein
MEATVTRVSLRGTSREATTALERPRRWRLTDLTPCCCDPVLFKYKLLVADYKVRLSHPKSIINIIILLNMY